VIGKIKNKLRSKDGKALLENFVSLSALQIFGMILPLITLPYIIRVIGFEKYGIIVFASSLIAYFQSLTDFSFKITAVRDVAVFKESQNKLNLIYSKVIIIKGLFLIISLLLISLIVFLYPPFSEYGLIYGLTMLMLVGHTLFPEWFFQGIEKMRYITYLNLGIKTFFTICVFLFIKTEEDFWIYPLLQSAGLIGAGLVGQLILIYRYKLKFVWLPKRIIKNTITSNFPVFVNQFVPTLFNNTTIFLMGIMVNTYTIGVFDAIKKIIRLKSVLIQIVSRVFFPYLNRNKQYFKKFAKISMLCFAVVVLLVLLSHPILFEILNIDDDLAFTVLLILSIGILFIGIYSIYSTNFLLVHRADKIVMKITVVSSVIGFAGSYPLVYYFGMIGGAVNIMFSQLLLGGLAFIYYKKYSHTLK